VAVWLHAGLVERLSRAAKRGIEDNELLVSPMVLLEMECLYRRKRIAVEPVALFSYLHTTFGIGMCDFPFPAVALSAISLNWAEDPFDRLIVAQAAANHDSPLITADAEIRRHYKQSVW
jgi:PIN domain nuclease of toxin-antitoxin system